ncbi:MAG: 2-hydroxyacyl-CoA dehydratase subunit D [Candidatus Binatia bacterium]
MMEAATDFRALAGPIENEHVRAFKASGGQVVGFFCAHAPEELFWAAGMLPVRMRGTGSEDTSYADQYLGSVNCGFVRHTLDRILNGDLAFLNGLLIVNSCDHIRRLFDVCVAKQAASFCYYLDVPHIRSDDALARLTGQLGDLRDRLESFCGREITDDRLSAAIKLYNRTRALLGRAAELRATDPPRVSGSEVLAMSVAAASVPKDRFNPLLERRIEELEAGNGNSSPRGPRLMIVGGTLDDPGYLEVIESLGATVVADQLCWGSKAFGNMADEEGDPLEAIAGRMLDHLSCPRMIADYERRLGALLEAVDRYQVDGIVCERLKFCDLWGGEVKMLRESLKQGPGVPFLVLERDYLTAGGLGQLRTRVQAFLESFD